MYEGTITAVKLDRGFGFIAVANQPDVFFHESDLDPALEFDEALIERRVRFTIKTGAKGPRAAGIIAA